MKVKVISGFSLGGGVDLALGDEVELEDWNARRLIGLGFVAAASSDPVPANMRGDEASMPAVDEIDSREPEPENRDPRRRTSKARE